MQPAARFFTLGDLAARLGAECRGDPDLRITQVAPLESAGPDQLAYFESDAYREAFASTRAGAVIVRPTDAKPGANCIYSANPRLCFIRAVELFNPEPAPVAGVHPSAWVHPQACVAPSAEIAAFASVDAGAVVGERTRVGPGCRIGAHAELGDDCRLHANVTIYPRCVVGRRAVLNAGCVVGSDGFGGALDAGRWVKMPHIGRVVLGDDVEVGANTTIDRGALDDTVIGDGVKLDNLIQIGHNVHIGAHTTVAACAGIAGSARIGAYCVIGGSADIAGHLHLADGVQISPSTMVGRSIEVPGRYTGIFPWSEHRAWLKLAAALRRLGHSAAQGRRRSGERANEAQEDAHDGHH